MAESVSRSFPVLGRGSIIRFRAGLLPMYGIECLHLFEESGELSPDVAIVQLDGAGGERAIEDNSGVRDDPPKSGRRERVQVGQKMQWHALTEVNCILHGGLPKVQANEIVGFRASNRSLDRVANRDLEQDVMVQGTVSRLRRRSPTQEDCHTDRGDRAPRLNPARARAAREAGKADTGVPHPPIVEVHFQPLQRHILPDGFGNLMREVDVTEGTVEAEP